MKGMWILLLALFAVTASIAPTVLAAPPSSSKVDAIVSGGGHYLIGGTLGVQFGFSAIQFKDGSVSGSFHERTDDGLGTVDFDADVTCIAVDHELGRAWIGGVITANRSTSPDFGGEIFQPGHDIWFRVLDRGTESDLQDRRTFVGFEGGIPSSEAYCESRPWPADDARTWPVTKGNITIMAP